MPLIAAGLRQHVDLSAGGAAVFGAVLRHLHLKFGDRVDDGYVAEGVVIGVGVDDPIEKIRRVVGALPGDAEAGDFTLAKGILLNREAATVGSRREESQLEELASVEGNG